ncbi:MAG: SRPBCC family protein [Actinomycetes bacterium]
MNPVTVTSSIARPQEEVFDYLANIANMPEFTDHFLTGWHLTRENPVGLGAGARFRIEAPLNRFSWSDLSFAEVERPRRIVARGRGGKSNRIRSMVTISLSQSSRGVTKVEWTWETVPAKPSDRIMEVVGGAGWWKRKMKRASRRLRTILEEDRGRGTRATVAGG